MTSTSANPIPTAVLHEADATAAELRQMADLLELQGQVVEIEGSIIGTLERVYFTDGVAVNVHGLIDWSTEGKDYGRDFCLGPLYGAQVTAVPAPWIGYNAQGQVVKVYRNSIAADSALARRQVATVAPFFQGVKA